MYIYTLALGFPSPPYSDIICNLSDAIKVPQPTQIPPRKCIVVRCITLVYDVFI